MAKNINVGSAPVGQRLISQLIDSLAENDPKRRFCIAPKGPELSDGVRTVSIQELARAVNSLAWWIETHVGKGSPLQPPTIAYIGSQDIRYIIVVVACQKVGYKVGSSFVLLYATYP